MPITKQEKRKLKRLITTYKNSAIADSWAGSEDPEDYESLVESCKSAKKKLDDYITTLTYSGENHA